MSKKLALSSAVFIAAIATASAADLSKPVYTKAPPPVPVLFSWTGFYVGLNVGGKWATVDDTLSAGGTSVTFNSSTNNSWIAGGQVGYNWQAPGTSWVFGVEGDIDAQNFHRDLIVATAIGPFVPGDTFSVKSDWQASLRGRIGYAAWDRGLLYVTGGVAFTDVKRTVGLVGIGTFSDDTTRAGGTVGVGVEYAIWNNLSLGIEGRWSWYGHDTFTTAGTFALGGVCTVATPCAVSNNVNLNTAEVMGKLNFRF
jgi:outer membrane immunogenic protein